ncbi:MAG: alanyl-tRNA editing protein [Candidatus Bathyarchaeota archaeon]|jgi:alanyl-tRNA synthetase
MPGTRRLYVEDPYLKTFNARVLKADGKMVELDQTAFYPEGGGQVGDTGEIDGLRVVDTLEEDGSIKHILESKPLFEPGDGVACNIDWERRYRIMKLHSAAHIMEYFLWENLGKMERLGSRVDERKDRADYAYDGRLPPEGLMKTQADTNRFMAQGHEIEITPDPKRPEIRIWKCGSLKMPCGGTHVSNTSEIGGIRLKRKNPGRGKERVETTLN